MQAKKYTATRIRHLGVLLFLLLNCLLVAATTLQSFSPNHFTESSSLPAPLQGGHEESAIAFLCTTTVSTSTNFRVCSTTRMHYMACSAVSASNNSSYSYAFDGVHRPAYYDFLFRFNLF